MSDCVLITELGANPAPLVEALWALARQRGMRVRAAFVLTSARGRGYLDREVLREGGIYHELREALGDDVPPRDALNIMVAAAPDELRPDDAAAWNESRWQNALAGLRDARDIVAVFALAGGRQRTSGALSTAMFQLLARQRDLLVDVRVGDRRVEGARAGFYFPEQRAQRLRVADGVLDARDVAVHLVEVRVPRLRRLVGERSLASWADALAAGQQSIEAVPRVEVTLDVAAAKLWINERLVSFAEGEFVWFAALVRARKLTDEGWLRSDGISDARDVLVAMRGARAPTWKPNSKTWAAVLEGKEFHKIDDKPAISKLRSDALKRFKTVLSAQRLPPTVQQAALPHSISGAIDGTKVTRWRLPLDPEAITLR